MYPNYDKYSYQNKRDRLDQNLIIVEWGQNIPLKINQLGKYAGDSHLQK